MINLAMAMAMAMAMAIRHGGRTPMLMTGVCLVNQTDPLFHSISWSKSYPDGQSESVIG
jgi:hypothetical protein